MKKIKNFENYQIDTDGNVYRTYKNGKIKKLSAFLSGPKNKQYLTVALFKDNKKKNKKIHRLLAEAYLKGFTEDCVIDHIDRDKLNNSLTNLRVADYYINNQNVDCTGYYLNLEKNKWVVDRRRFGERTLKYFSTESEAQEFTRRIFK
jgi:hypothetical protein